MKTIVEQEFVDNLVFEQKMGEHNFLLFLFLGVPEKTKMGLCF